MTLLGGRALAAASLGDPPSHAALTLALAALAVTLGGSARLLTARVDVDQIGGAALQRALRDQGALVDATAYYTLMIPMLDARAAETRAAIDALERVFTRILCGIRVVLCGLALAALVA